jgi:hypothetical protein
MSEKPAHKRRVMKFESYTEIILEWPDGRPALAGALKVSQQRVRKWGERDFIPCEFWFDLCAAAKAAKLPVTPDLLTALAAKRRK